MGICNFRSIKEKNFIFLHSLFRTGSTYIWSKFRKQKYITCYYEPLNEQLLEEERAFEYKTAESLKHPFVEQNYFLEYSNKAKCTRIMKSKLVIDEFAHVNSGRRLKKYIDCLAKSTESQYIIFQFNRTALRVGWFKQIYQNNTTNIYLYRNHRDQWKSIFEQFRKGNPYFLIISLMIVSRNLWHNYIKPIDSLVHIPRLAGIKGKTEKEKFGLIYNWFYEYIHYLAIEEHYLIYYYLWLICLQYNNKIADICIDMTKLNKESSYREDIRGLIRSETELDVDFSDIDLPEYDNYGIEIKSMQCIEREVERRLVSLNI
jgi:hypothetical protein